LVGTSWNIYLTKLSTSPEICAPWEIWSDGLSHQRSTYMYILMNHWIATNTSGCNCLKNRFRLRDAVFRKRCEIELRWQLITNRKAYMGFRLQQKSITLNKLELRRNGRLLSVVMTSCKICFDLVLFLRDNWPCCLK